MLRRLSIFLLILLLSLSKVSAQNDSIVEQKRHNPKRATLYSTILPGLGQAYNKKYWKIPVVYAGIGTIFYFANTNGKEYKNYRDAFDYKSGTNTNVSENSKILADKYTSENLITVRDYYRRNMELSWIIMALWYGINIIDATVDAHFFEYDISENLTLKVEPMIQTNYVYWGQGAETAYGYGNNYGLSLKLNF